MYISNRRFDFGVNPKFNGAGLWRAPNEHWLAATALKWTNILNHNPVEVFVAPLEANPRIQKTFSVWDNSLLGAGLPSRSICLAEWHLLLLKRQNLQTTLRDHELAHFILSHGRPRITDRFRRQTSAKFYIEEFQADALNLYFNGIRNSVRMIYTIAGDELDDGPEHPSYPRRISRLSNLGDLSHIPPERIIPWIERNIR